MSGIKILAIGFWSGVQTLGLLMVFVLNGFAQQVVPYAQYMNNLTPYNPAYSVMKQRSSVNFFSRKQWVGIEGAPSSVLFNADLYLKGIDASIGLIGMNDKVAVENQTDINAFFAKAVRLDDERYLAVSVSAGARRYMANYSRLDNYDPTFISDIREFSPTVGFGVMLYNPRRFYVGLSLPMLSFHKPEGALEGNNTFRNTSWISAGYVFDVNGDISLRPAALYTYTPSTPSLLDLSTMIYFKNALGIGLSYRSNKELAGILNYLFNRKLSLNYSYRTAVGVIRDASFKNTTHEVGLGYRFGEGWTNIL